MIKSNSQIVMLSTAIAAVVFAYVLGAQQAAERASSTPAMASVLPTGPAVPVLTAVLTAGRAADSGESLAEMPFNALQVQADQMSAEFLPDTAETRQLLSTARLVRPVVMGAPLLRADVDVFQTAATSGLATALQPGLVAMSISVSPETAVAGLLRPGDRVDVIASVRRADGGVQARPLITGSRVLAVDRDVSGLATLVGAAVPPPATVTLEVTTGGATALSMARQVGQLSVVLSTALAMKDVPPTDTPILSSDALMAVPGTTEASAAPDLPGTSAVQVRRGNVPTVYNVLRLN